MYPVQSVTHLSAGQLQEPHHPTPNLGEGAR